MLNKFTMWTFNFFRGVCSELVFFLLSYVLKQWKDIQWLLKCFVLNGFE